MIRLRNVCAGIGKIGILSDINLEVPKGSLVAVIGANGAGKTTLLRVISRLLPVSKGEVLFDGASIGHREPDDVARNGLVHVPQGRQIIPRLTVEENLLIGAHRIAELAADETRQMLEREYRRFPMLETRAKVAGGSLSGGEQQMLALSRALMMKPRVLMLDEPSLGLAPLLVMAIMEALKELSAAGMTIILVEQMAMAALEIAEHGYVLQNGRITLDAPAGDLRKDPALVKKYLG
ncbi:MAG: ABC transporter ATP-binding protein [Desulfobacteria bacterium]